MSIKVNQVYEYKPDHSLWKIWSVNKLVVQAKCIFNPENPDWVCRSTSFSLGSISLGGMFQLTDHDYSIDNDKEEEWV